MKNRNNTTKPLPVLLWLFMLITFSSFGQTPGSTCSNAISITTNQCLLEQSRNTDAWFTFTADSANYSLRTFHTSLPGAGQVVAIEVYSDSCNGLTFFGAKSLANPSDTSIIYDTSGYVVNATYFVHCIIQPPLGCPGCPTDFTICLLPVEAASYFNSFAPPEIFEECGLGYCLNGVQMNQRFAGTNPATFLAGVGQPQPNTISVNCIPSGTEIVKAYLYFIGVGHIPISLPFVMTNPQGGLIFGNAPVANNGNAFSNSTATCWGAAYNHETRTFKADVTNVINGNGNYTINGIPTSWGQNNFDVNGATLLIIYRSDCMNQGTAPIAKLVLRDGLSVIGGGDSAQLNLGGINAYPANPNARYFFAIGDVQDSIGSQTFVNGALCYRKFWQQRSIPQLIAPNQTSLNATQVSVGLDCSALCLFGTYFQSLNTCPVFSAAAGADVDTCFGNTITLSGTVSGVTNSYWTNLNGDTLCYPCTNYTFLPTTSGGAIFWADNGNGCFISDTLLIHLTYLTGIDLVATPGNQASIACDTVTYTVTGAPVGSVFNWSTSTGLTGQGNTFTVNWNNVTGTVYVTVTTTDGCMATDSLDAIPCCSYQGGAVLTNRTASSVLNDPAFASNVTGITFQSVFNITINGIFTIDTDFTFLNSPNIHMGTNAKIDIQSGKTMTFDSSKVTNKCDYMWDGIYVPDGTAKIVIIRGSVIRQAKNAIVSFNGGNYLVENSTLKTNLRGIIVKAYSGAHPGIVRGSIFSMPPAEPFRPAIPALQFWQTKTLHAIEIESNADITIGDASSPAYQNIFRNMFNAIWSKQSHTTVVNARIARLSTHFNAVNDQKGIVSDGGKQVANPPYLYHLQVGGFNANEPVITDSMRVAIETHQSQRVYIYKNTLRNQRNKSIYVLLNDNNVVDIQSNTILNTGQYLFPMVTGIDIVDCFLSTVNITNNTLNQQGNTIANQNGTGIRVANTQNFKVFLNLAFNSQIRRYRTGILLQKLDGKNAVFVNNNTVGFFKNKPDYTSPHYGVKLEDCSDTRIDHNLIQRFPGGNWIIADSAFAKNLHGIYFQDASGSSIYQNDLRRMGNGIFGHGLSGSSTLACNDLWNCYNGFNFGGGVNNSADIGDQILDQSGNPAPTGNVYTNNVNTDLTGFIQPSVNWYESSPINAIMAGGSLLPANNPQTISTSSLCGTIYQLAPPPATQRSLEAGNAILTIQNSTLSPEEKQNIRKNVHRKLRQNPNWLNLNTPQDTMYQNFYAQTNAANTGLIRNVEEFAAVPDQPQATATNNTIAPAGNIEANIKAVNDVYIRTWMLGVYEFTPTDSATLYTIAIQNPGSEGAGVYSARVMLGLIVDDLTGNASYHTPDTEQQPVSKSTIYPNPATKSIFVEMKLTETQTGTLEIFDLNGRLVKSEQVKGAGLQNVNVAEIEAGVYMVRLIVAGETRINERLVILK